MRRKILVTAGLILLWTLAVIGVVFAEALWFAEPAVKRGEVTSIEQHLVRKLSAAAANQKLGSAGLVLVQGGKIAAEHGFGVANAETQAPVKADQTLYLVGSVSKAVTAWGVMKLVEEGKLGLDEPVMRHLKRWRFPGSEAYRDKVTVRQLLSHTAGIDDGFGFSGFLPGETVQTLEESLTFPKDTNRGEAHGVAVTREPGAAMSYSSAGYTVLQLLIEEVTGRRFADYMKEAVLQPLGMTKASFDLDAIVAEGRTQDLATSFDRELKPHPQRRYTAQAAVSLRATPHDLAQFVLAYTKENSVLKPETLKLMLSPQPGTGGTWGLGQTLYVANDSGGQVVGHSGGAYPAAGAMVRVNPATSNGVVLTGSGGRGAVNQLVHDWVYWETGKITSEARLQIAQDRLLPASVAIILGAIAFALWRLTKKKPALMLSGVSLCGLAVGLAAPLANPHINAAAQTAEAAAQPGPRATHSLAYAEQQRRVILLDGTWPAIQPEFAELWGWDGKRWERLPGTGPPARYASGAVYDSRRKRIVVYGGRVGKKEEIKGDTWEWDGQRWQQMADTSVGARDHLMLAYDAARGTIVLYGGGIFPRRPGPWATDTWEWDGTKWMQVATHGPVGRISSLVYDSKHKQVVLFGGVGAPPGASQPQPNYQDTWVWDGKSWRKVSDDGPPARDRHALAFDRRAGVVLLYGGGTKAGQFGDMWQWDGKRWAEIRLTGPTPGKRELHAMAYDAARDRTVLYGGNSGGKVLGDTWEWDGKQWSQIK